MSKPDRNTETITTVTGVPFSFATAGSIKVTATTTSSQPLTSRSGSQITDELVREVEQYVRSLQGQKLTSEHADHIHRLLDQIRNFALYR